MRLKPLLTTLTLPAVLVTSCSVQAYTGTFTAPTTDAQHLLRAQTARVWVSYYLTKNEAKLKKVKTHKHLVTMVNRSPFCKIEKANHFKIMHVNMQGKTAMITTTSKHIKHHDVTSVRNIVISKCASIRGEPTESYDSTVIGIITRIFL